MTEIWRQLPSWISKNSRDGWGRGGGNRLVAHYPTNSELLFFRRAPLLYTFSPLFLAWWNLSQQRLSRTKLNAGSLGCSQRVLSYKKILWTEKGANKLSDHMTVVSSAFCVLVLCVKTWCVHICIIHTPCFYR